MTKIHAVLDSITNIYMNVYYALTDDGWLSDSIIHADFKCGFKPLTISTIGCCLTFLHNDVPDRTKEQLHLAFILH